MLRGSIAANRRRALSDISNSRRIKQTEEFDKNYPFGLQYDTKESRLYDIIAPTFLRPDVVKISIDQIEKYDETCLKVIGHHGDITKVK